MRYLGTAERCADALLEGWTTTTSVRHNFGSSPGAPFGGGGGGYRRASRTCEGTSGMDGLYNQQPDRIDGSVSQRPSHHAVEEIPAQNRHRSREVSRGKRIDGAHGAIEGVEFEIENAPQWQGDYLSTRAEENLISLKPRFSLGEDAFYKKVCYSIGPNQGYGQ